MNHKNHFKNGFHIWNPLLVHSSVKSGHDHLALTITNSMYIIREGATLKSHS